MVSISPPMHGAGRGDYYVNLAEEDFYLEWGDAPGAWHGAATEPLGVTGQIEPQQLRRILDGYSPDASRTLVQNGGDPDRQSGWDLTFNAPKSVSVFWSQAPKPVQREIEAAFETAVKTALDWLQDNAAKTRRGKGGHVHEDAKFLFGLFSHTLSREKEPHLHLHALLINLCVRMDGTTGSIWSKEFFKLQNATLNLFLQTLAKELDTRLNLEVEPEKNGFHIKDVPRDLCSTFSTRSKQIAAHMESRKTSGPVAAKKAALATRREKAEVNRLELFEHWRQISETFGWSTPEVESLLQNASARAKKKEQNKAAFHSQNNAEENSNQQKDASSNGDESVESQPQPTKGTEKKSYSDSESAQNTKRPGHDRKKNSNTPKPAKPHRRKKQSKHKHRQKKRDGKRKEEGQQSSHNRREGTSRKSRRKSKREPLVSVKWTPMFPGAPEWSPASKWKVPQVEFGGPPRPIYGRTRWTKSFWAAEIQILERNLFPNAPRWSPAKDWWAPVIQIKHNQKSSNLNNAAPIKHDSEHTH